MRLRKLKKINIFSSIIIPNGGFHCVVADPPWEVKRLESPGSKGFGTQDKILKSVSLPYPTMTIDEIINLKPPIADDAHLYLWTINKYVEQSYSVARAWGFSPSTLLVWAKTPMGLGPGGTFSITTEFCLFCRKGKLSSKQRIDTTWWNWKRRKHSQKPEDFQDIIESVSPGPYLELFARRPREGWTVWGNEV